MRRITILGLEGFPLVKEGDDIAATIVDVARRNGVGIEDGDVIVVSQKVVSKAEGRVVDLNDVEPSEEARSIAKLTKKDPRFVELVLRESRRVLKADPHSLVVEDNRGFTYINSGIDKSNVEGPTRYCLLPEDPDESALRIAERITQLTGRRVGVVVSDTSARPFRRGLVNFAIGLAYLDPFRDYRGQEDLFGYVLRVKRVAVADEIAAAAELVIGQGRERVPVAIIRGLRISASKHSARELAVPREEDLFRGLP